MDNLLSQAKGVNWGEYRRLENEWANALAQGQQVALDIRINYPSGSSRPASFDVEYTIDGVWDYKHIENE